MKSATSRVPASPARAPVNKIAERIQTIRVQKQSIRLKEVHNMEESHTVVDLKICSGLRI